MLAHEKEYPPEYRLGRSVLHNKLLELERSGCSMSWIIHDASQCVAYIVVYPQFSRLQSAAKERVIYVDDVFVKPGYEICLFRLIQLFTRQAMELGFRDRPIEGVCRAGAYQAFASHDSLLRKLGWELAKKSAYWDSTVNEEMCWLRWEPLYEEQQKVPKAGDSVSVSKDEDDDPRETARLVTFEQSARYAYRPSVLPDDYFEEQEPDELSALTVAMLGQGDEDLIEIPVAPIFSRLVLRDSLGIMDFFGTKPVREPARQRLLRAE